MRDGRLTHQEQLAAALRRRPDRIVLGEVRSSEDWAAVMAAMSVGHPGSMTSIHGEIPSAALKQLKKLARSANG